MKRASLLTILRCALESSQEGNHMTQRLSGGLICLATVAFVTIFALSIDLAGQSDAVDAPSGFDDQTNGFISQSAFDKVREAFEERRVRETGLGPVYNAESCAACHSNPVSGGISQILELRAG